MIDKVQLIKEEIERIEQILDDFNKTHNNTIDNGIVSAKKNICKHIKSFIDSLPEESGCEVNFTTKSEDLDEAAKHYLYGAILYDDVYVGNPTEEDCISCFKAGAEWQQKKDQETIELAEDHAMLAGMTKEREEMMKDAVDGYVSLCHDYPRRRSLVAIADGLVNFEYAEKVKIIIVKTEQQ